MRFLVVAIPKFGGFVPKVIRMNQLSHTECTEGVTRIVPIKKLLTGFNDMMTAYPELMNEWDFEKNKEKPQEIIRGSHKKAWWKCPNGHRYQTRISHRTCTKTGCPVCASMRESSVPEKLTFFYLNRAFGGIYSVIPNDR